MKNRVTQNNFKLGIDHKFTLKYKSKSNMI